MILLSKYDAYRWHEKLNAYVKGYFHDQGTSHLEIIEKMLNFKSLEEFTGLFSKLNGEFSGVMETDDFIFACVDYQRSFPLFFTNIKGDLVISDSPDAVLRIIAEPTADLLAVRELRLSGTTFGDRTLYQEIRTLGSGEALFFDKKTENLEIVEYIEFENKPLSQAPVEELFEEMVEVYENAFKNSLSDLGDRTLVVPIKNGWWERLLMKQVKDLGLKKVILYSYGSIANKDVDEARKIAEYYGYPWHMIEYTGIDWFVWYTGPDFREYKRYSTLYNGVPNIEEYLAIKRLTEKKIIPEDSVFMNVCFTGYLRGESIPKNFLYEERLTDKILKNEILLELSSNVDWHLEDYLKKDEFIDDIFRLHKSTGYLDDKSYTWKLKYAYWKERIGKYASNGRRIYEMYGYTWKNLQIEKNIVDFWSKVPANIKYKGILQNTYDRKYNQDLLDFIGSEPSKVAPDPKLDFKDRLRNTFPALYRRYEFKKKSKGLVKAYDEDPLLWYNIVSRRDFEKMRPKITNILGMLSIKYIWDFMKENNFDLGE